MPLKSGASLKTTVYGSFRGADFSTDPSLVDKSRSPLCTNMIADAGGMPEKRPGWRVLEDFSTEGQTPPKINGLHSAVFDGVTAYIAHVGKKLYRFWPDGSDEPLELYMQTDGDKNSVSVFMNGELWILTGSHFLRCDGFDMWDVETGGLGGGTYVPTTTISRAMSTQSWTLTTAQPADWSTEWKRYYTLSGTDYVRVTADACPAWAADTYYRTDFTAYGGTSYEAVNLLSGFRFNTFLGDGEKKTAVLDTGMTAAFVSVWLRDADTGVWVEKEADDAVYGWTADGYMGTVTFNTAPPAPAAGAEDNVKIRAYRSSGDSLSIINGCTILSTYGVNQPDRLVFSGHPDYPNRDWMSAYNNPTYVPDTSYSVVGSEASRIMGYCRVGKYQAIVKEPNGQDATVFLREGSVNDTGETVFTVKPSVAGVGAVAKGSFAQLMDEPLFLSGTGIYAVTTNALTTREIAQDRSYYLDAKLTAEASLENAEAVSWRGLYALAVNSHMYLLDGRQRKTYRSEALGDYVYEGYYWENVPARRLLCVTGENGDELFFGTEDGRVCRFNTDKDGMERWNDDGEAICAVWATAADDDGDATILKTLVKPGCAVTLKPYTRSSAKICFRSDRDCVAHQAASGTMDIFDWEDIDFGRIGFDANDAPQEIFAKTRVKKYKRLQIIAKNDAVNEGFGVFAITKHYTPGGFAKR